MESEKKYTRQEVQDIIAKGLRYTNVRFGMKDRLYDSDVRIIGAVTLCFDAYEKGYPPKSKTDEKE